MLRFRRRGPRLSQKLIRQHLVAILLTSIFVYVSSALLALTSFHTTLHQTTAIDNGMTVRRYAIDDWCKSISISHHNPLEENEPFRVILFESGWPFRCVHYKVIDDELCHAVDMDGLFEKRRRVDIEILDQRRIVRRFKTTDGIAAFDTVGRNVIPVGIHLPRFIISVLIIRILWIALALLAERIKRIREILREKSRCCRRCGYSMSATRASRCPECGDVGKDDRSFG
jgi:hypothetical protein